jgi:hypothetical protein
MALQPSPKMTESGLKVRVRESFLEKNLSNLSMEIAGCNYDPTNRDDEADDDLLSLEEMLGPLLRKEISRVEC